MAKRRSAGVRSIGLKPVKLARNTNTKAPSNTQGTMRVNQQINRAVGGKRARLSNPTGSMVATSRFTSRGR